MIDIRRSHTRLAASEIRKQGFLEMAFSVIEIQAVLQKWIVHLKFITTAYDVQIEIIVTISIKKYGIDIFACAVLEKGRLIG